MKIIILLISILFVQVTYQTTGVDVSDLISQDAWSCLQSPGGQGAVQFAIVRAYQSNGNVDPNGSSSITNAKPAGIPNVDAYIFPCVGCGNPASQVDAALSSISGTGYGTLWLDIENYAWNGDQGVNQAFIQGMIDEGVKQGASLGIYTNYYNWQAIVGLDWTYAADQGLPLWYAHYDNNPSFGDFQGFGGWSSPSIKQYIGDATSCGVGIDYNWQP